MTNIRLFLRASIQVAAILLLSTSANAQKPVLDSSLRWSSVSGIEGDIDAVIPLWNAHGRALFLQPGAIFWRGAGDSDRIDANFGLVYRTHLGPDFIGGGSIFYDYDFRFRHRRLGVGADFQRGDIRGAVNYYYPIGDWLGGRYGFEEHVQQGMDLRIGIMRDRLRLNGSLGIWESDESNDWSSSYGLETSYRVLPGVFLEGGYKHYDDEGAIESGWEVGLAFRFSFPGLEGYVNASSLPEPNLWEPIEREKRILYTERVRNNSDGSDEDEEEVMPSLISLESDMEIVPEGDSREVVLGLNKPLEHSVTMVLSSALYSTAQANDYLLNVGVVFPDVPQEATHMGDEDIALPVTLVFPEGSTGLRLRVTAREDNTEEPDEQLDLTLRVKGEDSSYVLVSDVSLGVIIPANDDTDATPEIPETPETPEAPETPETPDEPDSPETPDENPETTQDETIEFAQASSVYDEGDGSQNVSLRLSAPAPNGMRLVVTGSNGDVEVASPVTIAQGLTSANAVIPINIVDNDIDENDKNFTLRITSLAEKVSGWSIGARDAHEITIRDNDAPSDSDPEPDPQPPAAACDKYVGFSNAQGLPSTNVPSQLLREGGQSILVGTQWEVWIGVLGDAVGKLPAEGVTARAVFVDGDGDNNDDVIVRSGERTFTPEGWHSRGIDLITFRDGIDEAPERVSVVLELVNPPSGWCVAPQFGRLTWTIAANAT